MNNNNGWFFEQLNFTELKSINDLKHMNLCFAKDGTLVTKGKRNSMIPKTGGIYIYYDKYKTPLYVGRTQNLRSRHNQHMKDSVSPINRNIKDVEYYSYALVDDIRKRNVYEMIYICEYKPKFNDNRDTGVGVAN